MLLNEAHLRQQLSEATANIKATRRVYKKPAGRVKATKLPRDKLPRDSP